MKETGKNRSRSQAFYMTVDLSLPLFIPLFLSLFLLYGCHTITDSFHSARKRMASVLELGKGIPLEQFSAKDGDYFPAFLKTFFPKSLDFERENRQLLDASTGIKVIEVKRLSKGNLKYNEANLSWSADGVYLGYEIIGADKRQILVKDLGDNYSNVLLKLPKDDKSAFLSGLADGAVFSYNAGLRWSQDSTRYTFMSNGGVGEYDIYVGAIGSREKVIAQSPSKEGFAAWSPKESEIAFVSSRSGNGDIYIVDAYGVNVKRLSESSDVDIFPAWFPDGQGLVYSSGDSLDHDLKIVRRLDGVWQKPINLTEWSADELKPTVSQDGRFIAFYANNASGASGLARTWNLHVVPTEWTKTYKLPLRAGLLKDTLVAENVMIDINTGPAFSPDSTKIFYVKKASRIFNPIESYDLASGVTTRLATGTRMNRDVMVSRLGVLSFRAQTGAWDRVYLALTNQGIQIQSTFKKGNYKAVYPDPLSTSQTF